MSTQQCVDTFESVKICHVKKRGGIWDWLGCLTEKPRVRTYSISSGARSLWALIIKPKSHVFGDPREILGLRVGQNHGIYTNSKEAT